MSAEEAAAALRQVSAERLRDDVERLPGPRSRLHAPEAMARADELVVGALRAAGWQADLRDFHLTRTQGYLDLGSATEGGKWGPMVYPELHGRNVVAVKPGRRPGVVVVGAHHDTVRDSPGADDNGSGVAALLELARLVADVDYEHTLLAVAFDMEEIGLQGAKAFVTEQLEEQEVVTAIVFESLAYTSVQPGSQLLPRGLGLLYRQQVRRIEQRRRVGDWTAVLYRGSSVAAAATLGACLRAVAGPDAAVLLRDPIDLPVVGRLLERVVPFARDFARSDHVPFWRAGLPAVMLTDTADFRNPNYHRPSDTPDTLDYAHLRRIVAATALALDHLAVRRQGP